MLLPRRLAMKVIKKDGSIEPFNPNKIIGAISKATRRCMTSISTDKLNNIIEVIEEVASKLDAISIAQIQHLVVKELYKLDETVASAYDSYKNYKTDLSALFDEVYTEANKIRFLGDTSNANSDSSLVSTRRALTYDALNRRFYRKFFLNNEENIACKDGFIYPHDQNARLDTINCCLFNVGGVMKDGFEMGNIHYNEPKTLDVAFDVIGDIILSCASQQYGGFTVPEIDKILTPYASKSRKAYIEKYRKAGAHNAVALADADMVKDFTQGFQGLEMKLNSVGSSRGDYPFVTFTFGLDVTPIGKLCNKSMLKVRMEGQGAVGHKRPVLFPKLVMLFDDELHNDNGVASDVFKAAIKCTSKCMYPDYISLTGDGAIADIYKKYHKPVSCMGCRSFLSPYFIKGGYEPFDDNDTPIYEGRFNIGVVSINLPMIYMESIGEGFYEHLHKYLEMVRNIHIRTKDYLGNLKASMNPVGFMQGGFYGGNLGPNDKIEPVLKYATASLGITALNELNILATGKSLAEDNTFSLEVIKYINNYLARIKHVDHIAYSIYGTPAESLCFTGDTVVQVYNGNKQIKDVKVGDLVYSYNEHTKKIELNKVVKTMKSNKPVLKVNFDNGQSVICTLSHPFAVRKMKKDKMGKITGEYIEYIPALNLKKGDRLKSSYITVNTHGRSECTGGLIQDINAEYAYGEKPNGYVVHHINKNKLDNRFENLTYIKDSEHRKLHAEDTIKNYCFKSDDVTGEKNNFYGKHHTEYAKNQNRIKHMGRSIDQLNCDGVFIAHYECIGDVKNHGYTEHLVRLACKGDHKYKNSLWYYSDDLEKNHRVLSVELLDRVDTVYNIEVENNHNYYVGGDAGVLVHNCGYQLRHFVNKYGIIKGVSDKDYFSNSFHCHVTEDITPIQKQDKEYELFHQFNGGHIQYVRVDNTDNTLAIKSIILRGMKLGYYQGVNFDACYCEDCGKSYTNGSLTCPSCGSSNITVINRVCGYLGYSNIHGKSRMNDSKMSEIKERKSM